MINVQIELTASPALLDALTKIALAFQGQPLTAVLESTEEAKELKPARTRKVQETVKAVAEEKPAVTETATSTEEEEKPAVEEKPAAGARTITIEELRTLVRDKAQAGKREAIKAILVEMDSTSVTTLKEEQYADFLAKVEAL